MLVSALLPFVVVSVPRGAGALGRGSARRSSGAGRALWDSRLISRPWSPFWGGRSSVYRRPVRVAANGKGAIKRVSDRRASPRRAPSMPGLPTAPLAPRLPPSAQTQRSSSPSPSLQPKPQLRGRAAKDPWALSARTVEDVVALLACVRAASLSQNHREQRTGRTMVCVRGWAYRSAAASSAQPRAAPPPRAAAPCWSAAARSSGRRAAPAPEPSQPASAA